MEIIAIKGKKKLTLKSAHHLESVWVDRSNIVQFGPYVLIINAIFDILNKGYYIRGNAQTQKGHPEG